MSKLMLNYNIWTEVLTNLINNKELYSAFNDEHCNNDIQFMKVLYNNSYVRNKFNKFFTRIFNGRDYNKSKEKSDLFRTQGNSFYYKKDLASALYNYNQAIAFAHCNSAESANAYGNRSAVFFELKKYKQTVEDIERAFANGYTEIKKFKLNKRLILSLIKLGQINRAKDVLRKVLLNTNEATEIDAINDLELKVSQIQIGNNSDNEMEIDNPVLKHENTNFAFASDSIDIRSDENGYNRGVIAKRDIKRGEVLFVEPAFASVHISPEERISLHCYHCFKIAFASIPCNHCSDMYYCDDVCRNTAWESYHIYECMGTLNSLWQTVGIAHLAFRVFLKGMNNLYSSMLFVKDMTNKELPEYTSDNIIKYFKSFVKNNHGNQFNNYSFVFSLMTNVELMNKSTCLRFALTAVMVIMYLKKYTSFFKDIKKREIEIKMSDEEWELLSLSLMFRHILQQICNAHIIDSYTDENKFSKIIQDTPSICIGTALYPAISMMNHSCDPNIENRFHKDVQTVTAARDIKSGDEVFNCYGPNAARMSKEKRQDILLEQYYFKCCCTACK